MFSHSESCFKLCDWRGAGAYVAGVERSVGTVLHVQYNFACLHVAVLALCLMIDDCLHWIALEELNCIKSI